MNKPSQQSVKEEIMVLTPQSDCNSNSDSELENEPPSPQSPSTTLSHARQHNNGNHCHKKIKQEILSEEDEVSQSHNDCDTNNNHNVNINSAKCTNNINISNNNYTHKTKIARQVLAVIRNGDYEELLTILKSKPDLNVFINGQTALHSCLLSGRDVSWCRQLILNGANPNLSNHDGWQPLHLAAFNGLHESLKYLITCNKAINETI